MSAACRIHLLLFFSLLAFSLPLVAQDSLLTEGEERSGGELAYIDRSFLIIRSTTDFSDAKRSAEKAAVRLELEAQITDCDPHPTQGFECEWLCGCGEMHESHVPRGRYDDGNYVSVEFSSDYSEFEQGYYIVVASSGDEKDVLPFLDQVRRQYPNAYAKTAEVYIGCMH